MKLPTMPISAPGREEFGVEAERGGWRLTASIRTGEQEINIHETKAFVVHIDVCNLDPAVFFF